MSSKITVQFNPPSRNKVIKHVMKQYGNIVDEIGLAKFLTLNPAEKMIPFNLWFQSHFLKIVDLFENNQHIRTRQYKGSLLTPLLTYQNKTFSQLNSCLDQMSLYQPYYPETFYGMWEILDIGLIKPNINKILHIGKEDRLGAMEAIILYIEKRQITYQSNIYHCWMDDPAVDAVYTASPKTPLFRNDNLKINYLCQSYHTTFINDEDRLIKYQLINIDANIIPTKVFEWPNEEESLQATLFYFLTAVEHLTDDGSIIIRMNMMCRNNWRIIFDFAHQKFNECSFYRSSICHPFNPEIYLFMTKIKKEAIQSEYIKNMYQLQMFKYCYLNTSISDNSLITKYQKCVNDWINNLEFIYPKKNISLEWHLQHDFLQIGRLLNKEYIIDKNDPFQFFRPCKYSLTTSTNEFKIRSVPPIVLCGNEYYCKLIGKKSELNFCKRVMDTKPSEVFTERGATQGTLITWDKMMYWLDYQKAIKNELKILGAEMVTSAWIKMYEMLGSIKLPGDDIVTFHLCEAPGAFVSATNHYLSTKYPDINWTWYAQTLKPNDGSSALDDHYGLISKYPEKWLFGSDYTGDITHSVVIKSYASNSKLKKVDFMTADAGLKCHARDLNEQESYLSKINMGQIICILACLSQGKSAIFKTFLPLAEPLNISMIYLLTHLFETVEVTKPMSSHSHNSEIYFVLKGYRGIQQTVLDSLYMLLDDPLITSKSFLFNDVNKKFFDSYLNGINKLIDQQIQSLMQNYYYYFQNHLINEVRHQEYFDSWFQMNPVSRLENKIL